MVYVRGNRRNYDEWAAKGAKGWSYEDVLPYFKKLEDNVDIEFLEEGIILILILIMCFLFINILSLIIIYIEYKNI